MNIVFASVTTSIRMRFSPPLYDGMLVSAVVDGLGRGERNMHTRAQRLRYFRNGMKHFFRLPERCTNNGRLWCIYPCKSKMFLHIARRSVIDSMKHPALTTGYHLTISFFGYEKPGESFSGEVLARMSSSPGYRDSGAGLLVKS